MSTLMRLMSYLKPYRSRILLALVSMVVVGLAVSSLTLVISDIYDVVLQVPKRGETGPGGLVKRSLPGGKLSLLAHIPDLPLPQGIKRTATDRPVVFIGCFLVFLAIVKGLFTYLGGYSFRFVGQNVVRDLRNEVFTAIHFQSLRFFGEISTGTLMARILSDVERIRGAVAERIGDILQEFMTLLMLILCMLFIDWQLTLYALVIVPVVMVPIVRFGRRLRRVSRRSQEQTGDLASILHESIYGARIVKAFGMEEFEVGRFKGANDRLVATNLRGARADVLTGPVIEVLGTVAASIFLFYAASWIARKSMTPGDFGGFLYALYRSYLPAKKLSSANNVVQQALAAAIRVFDIVDRKSDVVERPDAVALPQLEKEIRFNQVSFEYGSGAPVLKGVDLTVAAGEVVAIVGRTGVGKTTLLDLIPRFYDVSGGSILIDGMDVREVTVRSLRKQIGMVTQETILFNDTVMRNIAYGRPETAGDKVEAAAKAAFAHDFILGLPAGYETLIGERGARLSGGERQRIAIARAILKDPPILLLDEATSALDSVAEAIVQKALANLMSGRTVFMIAHRLQTVRDADRIVVLAGGAIIETGSHSELLAAGGHYAELYRMQFEADEVKVS